MAAAISNGDLASFMEAMGISTDDIRTCEDVASVNDMFSMLSCLICFRDVCCNLKKMRSNHP